MLGLLKKKKWIIAIAGALILLILCAGAAWFFYFKPAKEADVKASTVPPPPLHKEPFKALWALKALEFPISGRMGGRTLRLGFSFHLDSPDLEGEMALRRDEITDGVNLILSGRTVEEMEQSESRIRLKYDVLRLVNGLIETGRVRGVYITEFLIL